MNDRDTNLIVLPTGGSVITPVDPALDDAEPDCPPCEELARIREALIEMRRGMLSLDRGFAALLAAVDRDGCGS